MWQEKQYLKLHWGLVTLPLSLISWGWLLVRNSVYQVQCVLSAYIGEQPPPWENQIGILHSCRSQCWMLGKQQTGSRFASWALKMVESYFLNLLRFSDITPRMCISKWNRIWSASGTREMHAYFRKISIQNSFGPDERTSENALMEISACLKGTR